MIKRNICGVVFIILLSVLITSTVYSQEKLAQSGFQFLSVGQDARAAAMGEAFTTIEGVSNALFYNPAGIARIPSLVNVAANYFTWIADIKYTSFSVAVNPWQGQYGVIGLSIQAIDYGELQGTMVWKNPQGYVDTEVFSPNAIAIGLGYGRALTERFVVGGHVKFVAQELGKSVIPGEGVKKNIADVVAFDFGTIYRTGFKSFSFGMSVRNFSQELKFEEEGFQLPLTFKIGVSANAFDFFMPDQEKHSLLIMFDAVHPRSHAEYINVGTEYVFLNTFALRLGYITGQDEYDYTAGFGVKQYGLEIDYAYTPFDAFDNVHRFSLRFSY